MTDARKALESAREALAELAKDLHARAMNEQIVHHWHPKSAEKTLTAIDAALASGKQGNATHRHKMRGSEYVLLGIGKMQSENWYEFDGHPARPKVDMREVAVYRGSDGALWVRPREEFEDGRFEPLPAPPAPETRS